METVAIVGGGIGGLACAILLARQGFNVTIFDKAKSPQPVGAGFLLQPPGQAILATLGVLQEISSQAVPIYGLHSKTTSGRTLLDLDYTRLSGSSRNGLGVQRSTIYDALLKEASSSKLVNFVWDSNVDECLHGDNKVSVISNGATADFDLCILSSGSNSHLADKHFKNRIKRPYGWGCLWTTFTLPDGLSPNILHQRCKNSSKMMGILPVRDLGDRYEAALYWSMKSDDIKTLDAHGFSNIKSEITGFWPEASVSLEPLNFSDFVAANYNDIWTPKPFQSRLIAIGDVSHATSPQLGQGCTMALLDAWSLAAAITKESDNLTASLENWWQNRRYQLAYVRHLSRWLTPLFQSDSKLCEIFRDWLMAPAGHLPVFDKIQLETLASEAFLTQEIQ